MVDDLEDEALEASDPLSFAVKKVKDIEDQLEKMKGSFEEKFDQILAKIN